MAPYMINRAIGKFVYMHKKLYMIVIVPLIVLMGPSYIMINAIGEVMLMYRYEHVF